jgi:hypothetical protein
MTQDMPQMVFFQVTCCSGTASGLGWVWQDGRRYARAFFGEISFEERVLGALCLSGLRLLFPPQFPPPYSHLNKQGS